MERKLRNVYVRSLVFITGLWAIGRVLRHCGVIAAQPAKVSHEWGPFLFILTAVIALAGPIVYRTLFAHVSRRKNRVDASAFIIFERNLIITGLTALVAAMIADILAVAPFYRSGAFLMALYAVYCSFPSSKRLDLDRRLFRVAGESQPRPVLRLIRGSSIEKQDGEGV